MNLNKPRNEWRKYVFTKLYPNSYELENELLIPSEELITRFNALFGSDGDFVDGCKGIVITGSPNKFIIDKSSAHYKLYHLRVLEIKFKLIECFFDHRDKTSLDVDEDFQYKKSQKLLTLFIDRYSADVIELPENAYLLQDAKRFIKDGNVVRLNVERCNILTFRTKSTLTLDDWSMIKVFDDYCYNDNKEGHASWFDEYLVEESPSKLSIEKKVDQLSKLEWRCYCFCSFDCPDHFIKSSKSICYDVAAGKLEWKHIIAKLALHARDSHNHDQAVVRTWLEGFSATNFIMSRKDVVDQFTSFIASKTATEQQTTIENSDTSPSSIQPSASITELETVFKKPLLCSLTNLSKHEQFTKLITAFRHLLTLDKGASSKIDAVKKSFYSELKLMESSSQCRCPFSYLDRCEQPSDSSYLLTPKLLPGPAFLAHIVKHVKDATAPVGKVATRRIATLVGQCIEGYFKYVFEIPSHKLPVGSLADLFRSNCKVIAGILLDSTAPITEEAVATTSTSTASLPKDRDPYHLFSMLATRFIGI